MHKALLVVDPQNDFFPNGAMAVPGANEIISSLNRIITIFRKRKSLVIVSRDWHPTGTRHFQKYGGIFPVHCVQYSKGAEFHPDINLKNAIVVSKGMEFYGDAYSPFDGVDNRGESLNYIFMENRIREVYVTGLATENSVLMGVLGSLGRGMKTFLVKDATRAVNISAHDGENAIQQMENLGAFITSTKEILSSRNK